MVSPRPEPPYLRVVDESACVNRSNTVLSFLLGPMLDATGHDYGLTLSFGALLAAASVVTFRTLFRAARGRVGAASSA